MSVAEPAWRCRGRGRPGSVLRLAPLCEGLPVRWDGAGSCVRLGVEKLLTLPRDMGRVA